MSVNNKVYQQKTFLSYEITPKQDALINHLLPSITSFLLYIFLFASDVALVFRHFKDENPIWASVTLLTIYFPVICAYMVTVSSWELWPDAEGCERDNCVWFSLKTLEHLLFPVWAMWRYAERIFWSIEAVRSTDDEFIAAAIGTICAPRSIELYFFFQAFLHSLPQMLLQLNILMRQNYDIDKQTADAEILSFAFNLTKVAATVTFYQRFKSQKLAGKQYPWLKSYKYGLGFDQIDSRPKSEVPENRPLSLTIDEPVISESRRSSDIYLEPELRELPYTYSVTSIIDGPKRKVYQEVSEPDFNVKRVVSVKALPEDDLGGKIVSFFWWSCFLLARIFAISSFFYFYPKATAWVLFGHVLVVIAFLIYDVKSDGIKRAKALFFVFIGLIYIFVIIEFKIKFKKVTFMYCGYFCLVFLENFVICMVWWINNVEDLRSDFWFRYMFYFVIGGSLLSVSSMLLYMNIYKPKNVVVAQRILN